MYQFSLEYFNALFLTCLQNSEKNPSLDVRLENIRSYSSLAIYNNVSRGLFGEHKITFSFMLTTAIMRNSGQITPDEWALFLVGAGIVDEASLPPTPLGVDRSQWELLCTLAARVPALSSLPSSLCEQPEGWRAFIEAEVPWEAALPELEDPLSLFHRLLMVKVFRPEKIVEAAGGFITQQAGKEYIEQSPLDLAKVDGPSYLRDLTLPQPTPPTTLPHILPPQSPDNT